MQLYNTLSRKIEDFIPINKGLVNLFVCGPTVYDYSHLGHAKTYTQFDILARVLRSLGFEVCYLQNITDIDDKILQRAQENETDWTELSKTFETEYMLDMQSLNNTSVSTYARATNHIQDIINQILTLVEKGHAYKIDDGVYFEISTFANYGKLSGRTRIQENDAQTRIDQCDQKKGWNDFCLWKFSKDGDPSWDAPFGSGRPGWHIEDTAITEHFFGPQYDIHGGAIDLIFPHHEAEVTQMESASGKSPLVKYWMHTGFLNINKTKMSKSLGNFLTIRDLLKKGVDPMAIRLLMIQSHYRSTINFSLDNLEAAANRLTAYKKMAEHKWQTRDDGLIVSNDINKVKENLLRALSNDLDTPDALCILSKLEASIDTKGISSKCTEQYEQFLIWLDELLGLGLNSQNNDSTEQQKVLLSSREAARHQKDWQSADTLRIGLKQIGLDVTDSKTTQHWSRYF